MRKNPNLDLKPQQLILFYPPQTLFSGVLVFSEYQLHQELSNVIRNQEAPLLASSSIKGMKHLAKGSLKTSCPLWQFQIKWTAFLSTALAMYIIITIPAVKNGKSLTRSNEILWIPTLTFPGLAFPLHSSAANLTTLFSVLPSLSGILALHAGKKKSKYTSLCRGAVPQQEVFMICPRSVMNVIRTTSVFLNHIPTAQLWLEKLQEVPGTAFQLFAFLFAPKSTCESKTFSLKPNKLFSWNSRVEGFDLQMPTAPLWIPIVW